MRHSRIKIAGVAVLLAVLVPSSAAFGYSSVTFFNGNLPQATIATSPVRTSVVGGEININTSTGFNLRIGYSHIETRANSGLKFQSESAGGGTGISHVGVSSGWNRCWWVATTSGTGSRPAQCHTRIP